MAKEKYPVHLSQEERQYLTDFTTKGVASARALRRARILLLLDKNRPEGALSVDEVALREQVNVNTIFSIRYKAYTEGFEASLQRKKRTTPPNPIKVTGDVEAHMIAVSCSAPPEGRSKWSMQLIADRLVELRIVEDISKESVRQRLKKTK